MGVFDFMDERGVRDVFNVGVDKLKPFDVRVFSLYSGERLDEMVRSIKRYGIITPIIVREFDGGYQVLSGNNRINAAKIAGLKKVPVFNMGKLSDEEARYVMAEANIVQCGFMERKISERAKCVAIRHEAMKAQGFRSDLMDKVALILKDDGEKVIPLDQGSEEEEDYNISPTHIRRYVRLNMLSDEIKELVDEKIIGMKAGVNLSYISLEHQRVVAGVCVEHEVKVKNDQAVKIRGLERAEKFSKELVRVILVKEKDKVISRYSIETGVMERFFSGYEKDEIDEIIVMALEAWFGEGSSKIS